MIIPIHPKYQDMLLQAGIARDPHVIDKPVDTDIIERLMTLPDFVRAYEPDGMQPNEFISYGLTQRTLAQFQAMEKDATPLVKLNWRFQQALYRAYYDAYDYRRLGYETQLEQQAMDILRLAPRTGWLWPVLL